MFLAVTVSNVNAAISDHNIPEKEPIVNMTEEQKASRLQEIKGKVNEIRDMDKSALTKTERRALKKELREMKKEARVISGGVYLSVGAIIVIILVLILIL